MTMKGIENSKKIRYFTTQNLYTRIVLRQQRQHSHQQYMHFDMLG